MKYLFSICTIAAVTLGLELCTADESATTKKCPLSGKCEAGQCDKAAAQCVGSECADKVASKCGSECSDKTNGKCGTECASKCAEGKCEGSKCSEGKCEGSCASGKGACCVTIAAAKKQLPHMSYLVGTESVCCNEMAAELAEKSNEKVQFVVAEKTYCCKEAAYTALVEETEKFVNAFVTPSKCEASGTTKVAGKSYGCCQAAAKQTELVSTSVKAIRMGYKVGDEEVCCVKHATTLAKETNSPIQYIVDGEATQCELTARLKLATAKYVAAVSALATAETADTTAALETVTTDGSDS